MFGEPSTAPEQGIASAVDFPGQGIFNSIDNALQETQSLPKTSADIGDKDSGVSVLDEDTPIIDVEGWRKRHLGKMDIFGAYSMWNHPVWGQFKVEWFCSRGFEERIGPYEDLIYGYEPEETLFEESYVNQCFTAEEVKLLSEYLEKVDGEKPQVYSIELPAMGRKPLYDDDWPEYDEVHEVDGVLKRYIHAYIDLSKDEHYTLPFGVTGTYYLLGVPVE